MARLVCTKYPHFLGCLFVSELLQYQPHMYSLTKCLLQRFTPTIHSSTIFLPTHYSPDYLLAQSRIDHKYLLLNRLFVFDHPSCQRHNYSLFKYRTGDYLSNKSSTRQISNGPSSPDSKIQKWHSIYWISQQLHSSESSKMARYW